ncbi:MAG: hypothetical protein L0271_20450 [Gemmatimonadetes bacterium]|nr:hypothetical protein [Gemmatimonadota bacterium]
MSGGTVDAGATTFTCLGCRYTVTRAEMEQLRGGPVATSSGYAPTAGASAVPAVPAPAVPEPASIVPAHELLLELVDPSIYRVNAFRVTGLPVTASPLDVTRRGERLKMQEKLGMQSAASGSAMPLTPPPDGDAVRAALQRLHDPERRLIDELFWFWPADPGPGGDEALDRLAAGDASGAIAVWTRREREMTEQYVSTHNLAVFAHAFALDLEHGTNGGLDEGARRQREVYWGEAFRRWRILLEQEGFWSRLTARIRELDDPRLTTGTARRLREGLPLALVSINASLAVRAAERVDRNDVGRHLGIIRSWDGRPSVGAATGQGAWSPVAAESMRRATMTIRDRIQSLCRAAEPEADADPVRGDEVARQLVARTAPLLAVLDLVHPPDDVMRVGARDEVALRALGCQISFGNKTEKWPESESLLHEALGIAASESARQRIQHNLTIVQGNRAHAALFGRCWFCQSQQPVESAAKDITMFGEITRTPILGGTRIGWRNAKIQIPRCARCKDVHTKTGNVTGAVGCLGGLLGVGTCVGGMANEAGGLIALGVGLLIATGIAASAVKAKLVPDGVKGEAHGNEFPRIQELKARGWQVGEKPSDATG